MFELIEVSEDGVKFFRNIDTDEKFALSGNMWWKDVDGFGEYFINVKAIEACRMVEN